MKQIIGIYHKDCTDGTTAGAVLLRAFPEAVLVPLAHGYSPQDIAPVLAQVGNDTEVYVLDCGLGVEECLAHGARVTVLDHHVSVRDALNARATTCAQLTYIFDEEKSGASLAWSHFFGAEPLPPLIVHVEDTDLWLGRHDPESRYVGHVLSPLRNNPAEVLRRFDTSIDVLYREGEGIDAYVGMQIQAARDTPPIRLRIGTYMVDAYNITEHESACGNMIARETGHAGVMFTMRGDVVKFSFRSQAGQVPSALDLATTLGGGGHVLNAGARIPLSDFLHAVKIN